MRRLQCSRVCCAGIVLATLATSLAVPASAQHAGLPARAGGVLVYPYIGADLWPKSLDPALLQDTQSSQVLNLVYSGLLKLDQQNHVVPDLAVAMPKLSNGGKTFTFTIRSDAKFSDGTAVTAQDFVYSWTRALTKKENSPIAMSYMGTIVGAAALNSGKATTLAGAKALDARTVQLTFTGPGTWLLGQMTYPSYYVVEQRVPAGENLVGPGAQQANVGTGPFMFSKPWRYRQEMFLAPNPYWNDAKGIKLSAIDVPMVSDNDAAHREYQAGQLPMTVVPAQYRASEQKLPDFHQVAQLATDYIAPNMGANNVCKPISCAPFNDLHFRRAMAYALNRQVINHVVLHDAQVSLCGMVPKGILGYSAALCNLYPYNPTKARQELALARQDFGGTIPNDGKQTLIYQTSGQAIVNEYTEIQREWAAVGIHVNIKGEPFNEWVGLVTTNTSPILEGAWQDDYPDPQDYTHNLMSIHGAYDIINFNNPQFERLVAQADVTPNGPDRAKLYVQAQQIAVQNVAYIPVGQVALSWRWKSSIQGLALGASFNYPIPAGNDWTNVGVQ